MRSRWPACADEPGCTVGPTLPILASNRLLVPPTAAAQPVSGLLCQLARPCPAPRRFLTAQFSASCPELPCPALRRSKWETELTEDDVVPANAYVSLVGGAGGLAILSPHSQGGWHWLTTPWLCSVAAVLRLSCKGARLKRRSNLQPQLSVSQ